MKTLIGKIKEMVCIRCGHHWLSSLKRPKSCPNCKSFRWDVPRQKK